MSASAGGYTPPESANPGTPAPTGQKWDGQPSKDRCGRTGWSFALIDEMCGATGAPGYLAALRTPMTRDGTIVGDHLYTVDATHLWVISLAPGSMREVGRVAGIGQPLSIAQHGGRLLVAAGETGLVVLDATNPQQPAVTHTLALPGPALDVDVEGDRAVVALGSAGFAVVDLTDAPSVAYVRDTPGFAAGAAIRGGAVYVADCAAMGVFDVTDGTPWSYQTLGGTAGTGVSLPYRDVEVRDGVAYVAAGRWGVVMFDVSNPQVAGAARFCRVDAPNFYASGVRSSAGGVFVAGGEWGVMRVEPTCPTSGKQPPSPLPTDAGGGASTASCTQRAPWEVVEWAAATPAPTPNRDPIQVFPTADRVYAFGEATRLGFRAVDERSHDLALVRRWEEPLDATAIAARAGRLFVAGRRAALFDIGDDGTLTKVDASGLPEQVAVATAAGLFPDGRWAFAAQSSLWVEGAQKPIEIGGPVFGFGVAETSDGLAFASRSAILELSYGSGAPVLSAVPPGDSKLPLALSSDGGTLYFAAPEWDHAMRWDGAQKAMPSHGIFTAARAAETSAWMTGLPRRVLMTAGSDLVEVAMLGSVAGLSAPARFKGVLSFPREEIIAGAATGEFAYLLATDRRGYTTRLHTVRLDDPPAIVGTETWLGQGMGIARSNGRLYVADASGTVRVFRIDGSTLAQEQLISLGGAL